MHIYSFIECTTLLDVNSQSFISFEGLQTENMIKIWGDPTKDDFFAILYSYRQENSD